MPRSPAGVTTIGCSSPAGVEGISESLQVLIVEVLARVER